MTAFCEIKIRRGKKVYKLNTTIDASDSNATADFCLLAVDAITRAGFTVPLKLAHAAEEHRGKKK